MSVIALRTPATAGLLSIAKTSAPRIPFCPFNFFLQIRWKKPANTAQTRLENRTRDSRLDELASHLKKLNVILKINELMCTRKRGPFVSMQLISRWRNIVGLNVGMGEFIHKYPHVFEVFTHPIQRNLCCKMRKKMTDLILEEETQMRACELESVKRVKKLLMMSKDGTLHVHALRLIRRELGLPEDFRESILAKYRDDFRLVDLEIVELLQRDEELGSAEVEQWREKEYKDKWLSEFETRYAFPIHFPTGFIIEAGFRDKMKNWQRLSYLKPYETREAVKLHTRGGVEQYEKRAVSLIHELLSLTVQKMVEVERLAHFRKDLGMEVNVRELLLKHPGIFYISTKGSTPIVFLREAYRKGCLIQENPIYLVRRKMLDLILLGSRNTRSLQLQEGDGHFISEQDAQGTAHDDWVFPNLDSSSNGGYDHNRITIDDDPEEVFDT